MEYTVQGEKFGSTKAALEFQQQEADKALAKINPRKTTVADLVVLYVPVYDVIRTKGVKTKALTSDKSIEFIAKTMEMEWLDIGVVLEKSNLFSNIKIIRTDGQFQKSAVGYSITVTLDKQDDKFSSSLYISGSSKSKMLLLFDPGIIARSDKYEDWLNRVENYVSK